MHPTVSQQLREVRRVLRDVVLPEVNGAYARETLSAALGTLGMLQGAWERVMPFLRWDNDQVVQILAAVAGDTPDELASRISTALAAGPPDPADFDATHERNLELRGLLAEAVPALTGADGTPTPALVTYVRERMARYPFSATVALPGRR
jgi:hypothetical protein